MASPFTVQIRIADEVQALLNTTAWLRSALENELGAAFGVGADGKPPKNGIDAKTVQKFRDVVKAFEALTVCKIKLDANSKKMAETMTPEEELAAVRAYVRSLDGTTRSQFLHNELRWHERREDEPSK